MTDRTSLLLPSRSAMERSIDNGTSEDYHLVRLYYSWYAGWFYRRRLQMVANLLGNTKVKCMLEVGTGSGIFIPHLLTHTDHVCCIDIHDSYDGIKAMLQQERVDLSRVELRNGSIFDIPYPDAHFEAAICISVLEHFEDPRPALEEMRRVVKPNGILTFGFPARNLLTDFLFGTLGYRSRQIHPASHKTILTAIRNTLSVEKVNIFPDSRIAMYVACTARNQQ